MTAPPQVIQVKRKRNEEGAVPFLRIEGVNKRRRSENFIYQRRDAATADLDDDAESHTPRRLKPVIHTSKPGDERSPIHRIKNAAAAQGTGEEVVGSALNSVQTSDDAAPAVAASGATPTAATKHHNPKASEPRRFHMSRNAMTPSHVAPKGIGKRRPRYSSPAVFIERTRKKKVEEAAERELLEGKEKDQVPKHTQDTTMLDTEAAASGAMDVDQPRRLKRPGAGSRTARRAGDDRPKRTLPPSMRNRWDVDMEQLAREMNEYTMQQLSSNVSWIEEQAKRYEPKRPLQQQQPQPAAAPAVSASPQQLKFRPKAPAKRFAERHPDVAAAEEKKHKDQLDVNMKDGGGSDYDDDDDDDYVVETYVRVPATALGATVSPDNIGLLVFDTEPDQEFFYGQEQDSDEEQDEDDEDENAENHYTADYPDDEVDSDDEFDRAPYHFRTGNASDMEEYDEEDDHYSADEDKDGLGRFAAYIRRDTPRRPAGL
ncbi:hypothetical protein NKR23_g9202 [Pleurostoma richardsiae]|uniref:Transcription factor Iwr1 domain-containing protein n=1 Tax=Pleurostoma richardsiae TaxID=41990 RepID=A0AA38R4U2_9PEZI|nr:hypothetical protein NKR23_g9202 [Pleurostoma richardsiae]